jgi:transposase
MAAVTNNSLSEETITITRKEYDELIRVKIECDYLKQELTQLKRMIFGAKSERFVPQPLEQLTLGLITPEEKKPEPKTETVTYNRTKEEPTKTIGHARTSLPAHLPRVETIIEPEGDLTGAKKIGEEITELLEYKQGSIYVKRIVRPKYVLPEEKGIVIGILPSQPISRGNAGPGLLSQLIIGKYCDHLPFYRQVQQFKRLNVDLAESTLNGWFSSTCELLEPLYNKLRERVQKTSYLQADETPIPVQTKDKQGATHKGYLWVYHAILLKLVFFDYRKTRSGEGPDDFLKDFNGTLQSDGYEVYTHLGNKKGIALLACMAHARRKFEQAQQNDHVRAEFMLKNIQLLYSVEREAREKNLTHEQRKLLRIEKSSKVLVETEAWLKDEITKVLPKSSIGKAISYTMKLWPRLKRYMDDGIYEIDNNLIENSIRPVAIGRKNYLFAGSHEAAQRAAMIYSFMGSCKMNGIEPYEWLKEILEKLPDTKMSELDSLLPDNWKK